MRIYDIKPALNTILEDLSFNIYLNEHRLRYQQEQKNRYYSSIKKFNSKYYGLRNCSVEQFVTEYNKFLNFEIKKSHFFLNRKIEANYRRNYHEGEVSPVTSLVFYLYFKTNKVQRFFAKLLAAAYRNPYTDRQSRII